MSGSGRESFSDIWQWSGGPTECPGVVGWPSRMSGSGREAHPNVQERLVGPPRCLGVVGRPFGCPGVVVTLSWMSRSRQETL